MGRGWADGETGRWGEGGVRRAVEAVDKERRGRERDNERYIGGAQ